MTRLVPGFQWIEQPQTREREKEICRKKLDEYIDMNGWTVVGEIKETTEFDEKHRMVVLHAEADVE